MAGASKDGGDVGNSEALSYSQYSGSEDGSNLADNPRSLRRRWARETVDQIAASRGEARASAPRDTEIALVDLDIHMCDLQGADWACAFEAGLLGEILSGIFDGDFCGSPASSVHRWKNTPQSHFYSLRYAALILNMFGNCCHQLATLLTSSKDQVEDWDEEYASTVEEAARIAIENSPRFWKLVYEFRESLLSNAYESATYCLGDSRHTRTQLAIAGMNIARLHQKLDIPFTALHADQEVMLFLLWMHCADEDPNLGRLSLTALATLLWNRDPSRKGHQRIFCQQIISEATTISALTLAFCKHYKVESCVDDDLFTMTWYHGMIIDGIRRYNKSTNILNYAAISCVLAACRRQLCRGTSRLYDLRVISSMMLYMRALMDQCLDNPQGYLKEWVLLALIIKLCVTFPDLFLYSDRPGEVEPAEYYEVTLSVGFRMLRNLATSPCPPPPSPALDVLRRYALQRCRELLEHAQEHPVTNNPKWSTFVSRWQKVLEWLPRPTREETEDEARRVTSLKRCAWKKCCCNVFKPPHRMRVCVGCYTVAYCGEKCREKDWIEGGHDKRCRRLKHSPA